jgi:nucleoside-diphosphate-sugar epimerase
VDEPIDGLRGQRVLVTGPTGFIGRHLVRTLAATGATVHLLVEPGTTPDALASGIEVAGISEVDITRPAAVREAIVSAKPQVVFHLAALVSSERTRDQLPRMMAVNHQGVLNILSAAAELPGARVIQMGSCEEYGEGPMPFAEAQRENPLTPYALSKVAATHACLCYHRLGWAQVVVLRPSVVYGPGETRPSFVRSVIDALLAGQAPRTSPAEQTRDFVYVQDVIEACMRAAVRPQAPGRILNICSGREVQLRDALDTIRRIVGQGPAPQIGALPYRENETMRYVASPRLAAETLGWTARTSLEEGVACIVNERLSCSCKLESKRTSGRRSP